MIGVIADDLAGAAELGGLAWRYGLSAEVMTAGRSLGGADVICIDCDSRSCPPAEAGQRSAQAASALVASGAKWVYKKVDSILRGHVLAELEAAMNQLRAERSLLVAANPALGRVIRQGRYFVGGKAIHETEFRLDPEHPRHTSSVRELLGLPDSHTIHIRGVHEPLPSRGIIIGEADSPDDLRRWASRWDDATLAAGASEFFTSLLERTGRRVREASGTSAVASPTGSELFVCGSASAASRDFMQESRARGVPVFWLPEELTRGTDLTIQTRELIARQVAEAVRSSPRVILGIGWRPVRDSRVACALTSALTQVAQAVLAGTEVSDVYAEGGATAASLARRMGWSRLRVLREITSGVVTLAGVGRYSLTVKPGSYPWPKEV